MNERKLKKAPLMILSFFSIFPNFVYGATILDGLTGGVNNDLSTVEVLIKNLTNLLLSVAGIAAMVMIIWSGVTMLISSGNPEKIQSAKKILTAAIVGLIIIISAYTILYYVVTIPGGAINP